MPIRLFLIVCAACAFVLVGWACGNGSERASGELTREGFIDAYVDLRAAALRDEDGVLTDSTRNAILERHDVTEETLLDYVDARGRDLDFMRDLWNEIEVRLDSVPPEPVEPSP
ncbi:MAG: hypothetical protein U5R14_05605 [Gemmatimonadota bacterium]|nr:hypothetical protein [Gemmatimonadota bacterium]